MMIIVIMMSACELWNLLLEYTIETNKIALLLLCVHGLFFKKKRIAFVKSVGENRTYMERETFFREIIAVYHIFDTFALGKQLQNYLPSRK